MPKNIHTFKNDSLALRKTPFQVIDVLIETKPEDVVYLFINKK